MKKKTMNFSGEENNELVPLVMHPAYKILVKKCQDQALAKAMQLSDTTDVDRGFASGKIAGWAEAASYLDSLAQMEEEETK